MNNSRYGILPGSGINLKLFQNNKKKVLIIILNLFTLEEQLNKVFMNIVKHQKCLSKNSKIFHFDDRFGEFDHLKIKYPHIEYIYANNIDKLKFLNFDCLVLPSYREGMPRVVLEFSLLGIPSIVTNVPGMQTYN